MASITSLIDLLYWMKTSWCRWIIFIKENLILLICHFASTFDLATVASTWKIFSFTGCSRNSKKLWSNAPIENFARDIGIHPYDVKAKVISSVETFWCFTKFFFHHKWNELRLLVTNMVYTTGTRIEPQSLSS